MPSRSAGISALPASRALRQWDIHDFPVPPGQTHPCVILSPDAICQNDAYEKVNILLCTSLRPADVGRLKAREVRLNGADGLDGPTVAKCHVILLENKAEAGRKRGTVCAARRGQIQRTIRDCFGLHGS